MPVQLNGMKLFRIGEALKQAGLSRATYFRWVREGRISDARYRDRNGRRVLTPEELRHLIREANKVVEADPSPQRQLSLEIDPFH